jgi:hypothetical protein
LLQFLRLLKIPGHVCVKLIMTSIFAQTHNDNNNSLYLKDKKR